MATDDNIVSLGQVVNLANSFAGNLSLQGSASAPDSVAGNAVCLGQIVSLANDINDKIAEISIQSGGSSFPDSIVTALGSQFIPSVSSSDDFFANSDFNIQFFDSQLHAVLFADNDYTVNFTSGRTTTMEKTYFYWGKYYLQYDYDSTTNKTALISFNASTEASISALFWSYSEANEYEVKLLKTSETACMLYVDNLATSSSSVIYSKGKHIRGCAISDTGSLTAGTTLAVCGAETLSTNSYYDTSFLYSPIDKNCFSYLMSGSTWDGSSINSYLRDITVNPTSGQQQQQGYITLGTSYANPDTKTDLTNKGVYQSYKPNLTFDSDNVTVAAVKSGQSPMVFYKNVASDSSSLRSAFAAGERQATVTNDLHSFYVGGAAPTSSDPLPPEKWLVPYPTDTTKFLNFFVSKDRRRYYLVTFTAGTYSRSSWIADAFKVWYVDLKNNKFIDSGLTLLQILDDISL